MKTRKILFVDDEQEILNSFKRALRAEPYESLFARSGHEALEIMEKVRVHVIVTDLSMPDMDGLTLLKEVKQKHPEVIRLVLSVHADGPSVLNAINKGNVYRYITKPWDSVELKLIVRQAIDVFNLLQEKRDLFKKLENHNRLLEKRVGERTRQLLALEKQAEIGKYASQIVHNVNNPLQAICGGVDIARLILAGDNPDLKRLGEYLDVIKSGAGDLEKIVAGVLLHVRDKSLYQTEQIDINEIIKRELDFFKLNHIYKYQIEKRLDFSDNLPPITGNPIQIKQIMDNLVKNAIDAMEHSPKKELTVQTRLEDKAVTIIVSDTGEGIAEEDLVGIWSPDFTTKPIGKGTGLGLASAKTMVDAYGGNIQVESGKGKGTTFIVRIPVQRPISHSKNLIPSEGKDDESPYCRR
jgi:two-component system sensor histidine kinase/response regulator